MQALLDVILPVFLVIGLGYLAVWRDWISDSGIDGLMKFAQNFAIPLLLFNAISTLDLGQNFDVKMLLSFYSGALAGFVAGLFGARFIFGRPWEDSVAVGFIGLFSNSLLLGLAITERAYGVDALAANYMIIALHAPFCYGIGITVMEVVRNRGGGPVKIVKSVLLAIFKNVLVVAILCGFIVNLSSTPIPGFITDAVALITRAALPAALFGMGGVLYRYRPEGDMRLILYISAVSLILHPTIVWTMGSAFELPQNAFRSAVLTSAMAPGVNAYIFANMYGVARRVAASSVLLSTGATIITAWVWLGLLG